MFFIIKPYFTLISFLVDVYLDVVVIEVILSWLIRLRILKLHTRVTQKIMRFFESVTHPVYAQIRKKIPPLGRLDFSPLILFAFLLLLGNLIRRAAVVVGA